MFEAITDYNLLLQNREPKFAKNVGTYLDGGTQEYEGSGYKLLLVNAIATPFGIMGYNHGPKLLLGKVDNGLYAISHVEFYSVEEHKKLMELRKMEKNKLQKENLPEREPNK